MKPGYFKIKVSLYPRESSLLVTLDTDEIQIQFNTDNNSLVSEHASLKVRFFKSSRFYLNFALLKLKGKFSFASIGA